MSVSRTIPPPCPQHIVIVGGGMVGVSLALMLSTNATEARLPWQITLIEQQPFPPPKSTASTLLQPSFDARSTALSAGSVALLQGIHCWELLSQQAEPIQRIHISDRGHYAGTQLTADDYAVDALGYVVENRYLGQCLLHELHRRNNISCIAPARVEACEPKKQGVVLKLGQAPQHKDTTMEADLVVVADGADSPLRHSLGIDVDITRYQQVAIIANIALAKPHGGVAYERFTDEGPLAVLPLSDCDGAHRAAIVWTRKSESSDELMALGDDQFLRQLQACLGYRADRIVQIGQRQSYPLQLVQTREQVRSHIAIVGNAAHFLHPVAGQGFNLSLRDCQSLADTVIDAALSSSAEDSIGSYKVLKKYVEQRAWDQQMTIGLTDAMVKTFSSSRLSFAILRQMGLLSLHALPVGKKQLAYQMMGLSA